MKKRPINLPYGNRGKFLLTMKFTLLLFFLGVMKVSGSAYSQSVKLNLNLQQVSLEQVLDEIKKQSDFNFLYRSDLLKGKPKVDIRLKNGSLEKALSQVVLPYQLTYEIDDKTVIIKASTPPPPVKVEAGLISNAYVDIKGNVKDEFGEPLPGVTILVQGSTRGTVSDEDGNFSINADSGEVLVLSFIGYEDFIVPIGNQSFVDVTMKADQQSLEEVVVIGYGTQKKRDVTGATNSIDNTQNETLPNTNVIQSLRGTVPGLSIGFGGNAGSGNSISIRGQNSLGGNNNALVVVDGIIYNGQIGNLNPNDIATIDVLKDASSTAIFGAKAANGVILITTKKGTTEKPTIQFNSYVGLQDFLMTLDFESPEQYVQKKLDYQSTLAFRGVAPEPNISNPVQYLNRDEVDNFNNGTVIEPLDRITQSAPIQSYNLNIGAKSDKTNYYIAGSWTDQQGKVIGDQFKRGSIRINLETQVTDWLKFGTNSSLSFVDVSDTPADLANAFWLSPYATWYLDPEQTILNPIPMTDGLVANPLMPTLNSRSNTRRDLFGIFYGEIAFPMIEGLTYRFTYSNNLIDQKNYNFVPSFNAGGLNRVSSSSNVITETQDMFLENLIKYNRELSEDHNLDVTLLYNYNFAKTEVLTANSNTFPSDILNFYSLSLGENQTTDASYSDYRAIAMMARVNYKFKNRYLFTLTGRRDGASSFSENHKFAFFPSAALGWILTDESFFVNNPVVDFLKIHVSYGANGNQGINRYQSLSRVVPSSGYNYLFDGETAFGIAKNSMGNPDLKWETTYAGNLGIDFEMLHNRLSGSLNLYNSNTKDLIVTRRIPTLNGFGSILSNLGSVNNKGIEIMLNSINIRNADFEWTTGFNLARNVNKITKLYGEKDENGKELDDINNGWFIGKSVNAYYNYTLDGVYQIGDEIPSGFRPGDYIIRDLNGDGLITPDQDRSIIGYNVPDFTYGFNTNFRYRDWSLFVQISGSKGGLRNNNSMFMPTNSWTYRVRDQLIDWWTPTNPSSEFSSMDYQNSYGVLLLQNPSFMRIQDISLSYEFSSSRLEKMKMNRFQVYLSAKNPLLITKWRGWDPETSGSGRGQYPTMKSITGGVNLSF